MNLKALFGQTFISVLLALVLYDLVIKGLVGKFLPGMQTYDDTYDRDYFEKDDRLLQDEHGAIYACRGGKFIKIVA